MRSAYLLLLLSLVGCEMEGGGPSPFDGEALYSEPHRDGNTFACATCHALEEPSADGFRRPGHPIGDAANRPTFKNGQLTSFLDAVNTCRTEWMVATPFAADDARWLALRDWLQEQAGAGAAPELTYERVDPPASLTGGDASAGQAFFNGACAVCHGMDAIGTERAPVLVPELLDEATIASRVRTSGDEESPTYPGLTGGRMPFWAADRISDNQLRDVIAFVLSNDPPIMNPDAGTTADGGTPMSDAGMPISCGTTHAKVGQVAILETRFHDVGGTATIIDDCTIEITGFTYDGTGIDVRLYGALGGAWSSGFDMSNTDLRRGTPYAGETITARLPAGQTLDDLDGISVWCVPAGASFGDGRFAAP